MKLAIFDIDGTLTNTNTVDDGCFTRALSEAHGINEINTDWASYAHTTDSGITQQIFQERFGREPEDSELDKLRSCFVNLLSDQYHSNSSGFAEIAGASVALNALRRESDWAVAIATGSWRESALLKLRAAKINFDGIPAGFAEEGLSREEILQSAVSQALAQHQLNNFAKVVSIGDGVWDVRTASRLKFAFVGIGGGERAATLGRAGAKQVIQDFTDYGRFMSFLNQAEIPREESPV